MHDNVADIGRRFGERQEKKERLIYQKSKIFFGNVLSSLLTLVKLVMAPSILPYHFGNYVATLEKLMNTLNTN